MAVTFLTNEDREELERMIAEMGENILDYWQNVELASRLTLGTNTDGLVYLFIDGNPTGNGIELPSGGIGGYIDSENNIIINNLPSGSYSVRYEMADGSTVEIGELTIAAESPEPDEPAAPAYINQIPISTDAAGEPFVGNSGEAGYKSGYRLSLSNGAEKEADGCAVTGFIPAKSGDVIRVKNITVADASNLYIVCYDSGKQPIMVGSTCGTTLSNLFVTLGTEADGVYTGTLNGSASQSMGTDSGLAYIRICSTSITDESILTINQEIV